MDKPISSVLVANRGEIAVRVIRTCRDLGIRSVAVYSETDRAALHVRMADAAFEIGPAPADQSYLRSDRILAVARQAKVDAIHPGYGFLSENADFAQDCADAGFVFIGPPPDAIRAMGDKTTARALMAKAGVPMAPGTPSALEAADQAEQHAEEIGFPVLIKAASGGGGKGMRLVEHPDHLRRAFEMATREARSAFGDGRVYLEKYLHSPRHVEVQVLSDVHGNVVHLFERDCSIQRRHQKVLEEAPAPNLSADTRRRMGEAAIAASRSCGYTNAGTVEFLVDQNEEFYFMEMNTRIQVEHPVTEAVTGIDLVAEQIQIASGGALRFRQDELACSGHAIECRIYAEDPSKNFLPDPGRLTRHRGPGGIGVRLDAGVDEGGDVPVHYDPMIAKLITWGRTREQAVQRMRRALLEYDVAGVRTTIPFCRFVLDHDSFVRGRATTRFVEEHFDDRIRDARADDVPVAAAVASALHARQDDRRKERDVNSGAVRTDGGLSPWLRRRSV